MQTFDRIFGSGPRIHLTMISLAVIIYFLRVTYAWTDLGFGSGANLTLAFVLFFSWGVIGLWSLNSLGRKIGLSLMRSGPYKYVRHPMYSAEIFFGWLAIMFLLNTWLALPAMLITFYLAKHLVRYEEQLMENHFQEEWRAYAAETPLFFPLRRENKPEMQKTTIKENKNTPA